MPCDYSKYPPNWKELRKEVLERAGHKCESCGVPNHKHILRGEYNGIDVWQDDDGNIYKAFNSQKIAEDYVGIVNGGKSIQVVLTVAHLDHDESNHNVSITRLAALCQRCHLRYDVEEKKKRRKEKMNKLQPPLF